MACGVRFLHGCEVTIGNQGQTFLDVDGDQKESAFASSSLRRRSIYRKFASCIKRNGLKTCRTRHGPNLTFSCARGLFILIFLRVAIPIIGVRDQVVFLGGGTFINQGVFVERGTDKSQHAQFLFIFIL